MLSHPTILTARTISAALPEPLAPPQPLRVLSVHRRALNLIDEASKMISIVTPGVGAGPFHIVLTQSVSFGGLHPGASGLWRKTSLQIGNWTVDWARARRWDPRLTPISIPPKALTALVDCVRAMDVFQDRWADMDRRTIVRLQKGAALIDKGISQQEEEALGGGTSLLTGLGPGLTPAGDDYLLGALARLWLDAAQPGADKLGQFVLPAATMTTRLSRTWLQYAVRGDFDIRWHHLRAAMATADENAICQAASDILSVGATSGPQAMAGFLIT